MYGETVIQGQKHTYLITTFVLNDRFPGSAPGLAVSSLVIFLHLFSKKTLWGKAAEVSYGPQAIPVTQPTCQVSKQWR